MAFVKIRPENTVTIPISMEESLYNLLKKMADGDKLTIEIEIMLAITDHVISWQDEHKSELDEEYVYLKKWRLIG